MALSAGFPNLETNLRRTPVAVTAAPVVRPLHQSIHLCYAEKGPVGKPIWPTNTAPHPTTFGGKTFDPTSKYFFHANLFATVAAGLGPTWQVRVAPEDAETASFVLIATTTQVATTQYEKNMDGTRKTDVNGDWIPLKESDNTTIVTEPGISIAYSIRKLGNNETISSVATVTTGSGNTAVYTRPIIAWQHDWVGDTGNLAGMSLYFDPDYDRALSARINSMLFTFAPSKLDTSVTAISTPVRDRYSNPSVSVSLRPQAIDPATALDNSLSASLTRDYVTQQSGNLLEFKAHVYSANVEAIGNQVLGKSSELVDVDPFMINILTAIDPDGVEYDHLVVSNAATYVDKDVVLYASGGSDGTMSVDDLEAQTVAFMTGVTFPAIADRFRFPITHFHDVGYSIATKEALMAFYAIRKDVKCNWSTQDAYQDPNTQAEDVSVLSALISRIRLTPESIIEGTPACRGDIYVHCGQQNIVGGWTSKSVPFTLQRMIMHFTFEGTTYINGVPRRRPNNHISAFYVDTVNWIPATVGAKQAVWEKCGNYAQYADTDVIHWPDLVSVFPFNQELLSNSTFVDACIYHMHTIAAVYTEIVGDDGDPELRYQDIQNKIDTVANYKFNGRYPTKTTVSPSSANTRASTVTSQIQGGQPNTIWNVTMIATPELT